MKIETLIAQLTEAKAKNLILRATISAAYLPASVVVQLPHTTKDETLDKFRQFLKHTFPHTTIQTWRHLHTQDEYNTVCISFTVDLSYVGQTPLSI